MALQNEQLKKELQRLDALIAKASAISDFELKAHWGKYLCVLVAGFLENALAEVYGDFVKKAASPKVASHARWALGRVKNPKASAFVSVSLRFSKEWAEQLTTFMAVDGRKDAVDGIMANRHLIAHGRNSDITIVRVSGYLKKAVDVVAFVETQCAGG